MINKKIYITNSLIFYYSFHLVILFSMIDSYITALVMVNFNCIRI